MVLFYSDDEGSEAEDEDEQDETYEVKWLYC